jgi:PilZ domain
MNLDIGGRSNEFAFPTERRGTSRFPLREEVRYRLLHARGPQITGVGQTLNIGSGGILFTTEGELPLGRMVELSVNWPARLDGVCLLKFVATGRVVRSEHRRAAVRIERYEFRTRGAAMSAAG